MHPTIKMIKEQVNKNPLAEKVLLVPTHKKRAGIDRSLNSNGHTHSKPADRNFCRMDGRFLPKVAIKGKTQNDTSGSRLVSG